MNRKEQKPAPEKSGVSQTPKVKHHLLSLQSTSRLEIISLIDDVGVETESKLILPYEPFPALPPELFKEDRMTWAGDQRSLDMYIVLPPT